ncbi:MAG: hypothetical protein V4550_14195 [Gemmatimonadota bacterium]
MTERRFNEDEVEAMFAHATEAQRSGPRKLASSDGMTLAELQAIGREVGIDPSLLARAASALDRPAQATSRTFLGLPVGVGRTVELDRKLSDEEWERLVIDLRETFDAKGRLTHEGSFRQWTNGNLQVLVEPTGTGQRVRFRTFKADAQAWMMGGIGMIGLAAATAIAAALGGSAGTSTVAQLGVIGAGVFAIGALRLPGWARLRRRQMEEIGERLADRQLPD